MRRVDPAAGREGTTRLPAFNYNFILLKDLLYMEAGLSLPFPDAGLSRLSIGGITRLPGYLVSSRLI